MRKGKIRKASPTATMFQVFSLVTVSFALQQVFIVAVAGFFRAPAGYYNNATDDPMNEFIKCLENWRPTEQKTNLTGLSPEAKTKLSSFEHRNSLLHSDVPFYSWRQENLTISLYVESASFAIIGEQEAHFRVTLLMIMSWRDPRMQILKDCINTMPEHTEFIKQHVGHYMKAYTGVTFLNTKQTPVNNVFGQGPSYPRMDQFVPVGSSREVYREDIETEEVDLDAIMSKENLTRTQRVELDLHCLPGVNLNQFPFDQQQCFVVMSSPVIPTKFAEESNIDFQERFSETESFRLIAVKPCLSQDLCWTDFSHNNRNPAEEIRRGGGSADFLRNRLLVRLLFARKHHFSTELFLIPSAIVVLSWLAFACPKTGLSSSTSLNHLLPLALFAVLVFYSGEVYTSFPEARSSDIVLPFLNGCLTFLFLETFCLFGISLTFRKWNHRYAATRPAQTTNSSTLIMDDLTDSNTTIDNTWTQNNEHGNCFGERKIFQQPRVFTEEKCRFIVLGFFILVFGLFLIFPLTKISQDS